MRRKKLYSAAACIVCLLPEVAHAEIHETLRYVYYDIDPHNNTKTLFYPPQYADLYAGWAKPEKGFTFIGNTAYKISWKLELERRRDICRVSRINMMLDIEVSMPQIVNVPPEKNAAFQTKIQPLYEHELGHVKIARVTAQQVEREIMGMTSPCNDITARAKQVTNRIHKLDGEVQAKYDKVTNHGQSHVTW